MSIPFIPVESSNIEKIGYDAESETLYVGFLNNTLYQYEGVTISTYFAFLRADSFGKFFNSVIKRDFTGTKIPPELLIPRIFVTVDGSVVDAVGATVDCVVVVLDKDVQSLGEYPLKAITYTELDRLIHTTKIEPSSITPRVIIDRSITSKNDKVSFNRLDITNAELDRLIRPEKNDFASEEDT